MKRMNPTEPKISDEEKAILSERLKTIEQDAKESVEARKALNEIRRKLKHPAPR